MMKITLTTPLHSGRPIELQGLVTQPFHAELWTEQIQSTFDVFERFVELGGLALAPGVGIEARPYEKADLNWYRNTFTYTWPRFPFGAAGFAVLLRMLGRLRVDDAAIYSVTIDGTPVEAVRKGSIDRIDEALGSVPHMRRDLPFTLDIQPTGAWVNVQCEFNPPIPDEIPQALNAAVHGWVSVVAAAGFQLYAGEGDEEEAFGIGVNGPVVAEDFLEWYVQMPDVPLDSLNCLVNVLSSFSDRVFLIQSVYIG